MRQVPDHYLPAPAILLGWAAWQAGDGALAWVAVDRCVGVDPHYALAEALGSILQRAVPPESWEPGFDWTIGLPSEGLL
ncbi:DUF4192 family protein [Nocardioides caeni]|uniref:DUF4192 family protein n=1 Tax=Nocardioides caeni TaxID=574700 RepID=A0A4S8NP56_9ACTN|nr:DUF4192 family protein [Nocardioides caeni]